MALNTVYKYISGTNYQLTDESYADVGATTFQLGNTKRAFKGGSDLEIWNGLDSSAIQLIENTDYTPENIDYGYTDLEGFTVYSGIKIINVTYQTGTLYITYKTIGSYTDPDVFNDFYTEQIGTVIPYSGVSVPSANYMFADGSAISKTTYSAAAAKWIIDKGAVSFSSSSGLLGTFVAHGLSTGARVSFTTTGSLPTGISADTTYYVIYVSADTFRLATTEANALAGTAIAYTNAGSDCSLVSCPWGIKDADEMYLPNFEGWVPVGAGQATINARAKDSLSLGAAVEDRDQKYVGAFSVRGVAGTSPIMAASGAFSFASGSSSASIAYNGAGSDRDTVTFNNENSTSPHTARVSTYGRETKKAINYIVRVL